jgi:hypothetical protein
MRTVGVEVEFLRVDLGEHPLAVTSTAAADGSVQLGLMQAMPGTATTPSLQMVPR